MEWSAIKTCSLKGPNVFRLLVPALIENFGRIDERLPSGPPVKIADVAGSRAGSASWEVHTDLTDPDPDESEPKLERWFMLVLKGRKDAKMCRIEGRLMVRSPSGAVLKEFKRQKAKLVRLCGDFDDDSDDDFDPSPCDYDPIDSVSFKNATENGCLFDGSLHVCVDVLFRIMPARPPESTPVDATGRDIMALLRRDLNDPPFSDFVLISADGQRIKTHKLLLATVSPVFRAMLDTDCRETREGCCKVDDADGETIKAMLGYVLGARFHDLRRMGFGLLVKLSTIADKYQIVRLKKDCEAHLASKINIENVFDLLLYADRYSSMPLKTSGFVFLEDNVHKAMLNELGEKLKEIGQQVHEEFLDHVQLRETGEPRKQDEK